MISVGSGVGSGGVVVMGALSLLFGLGLAIGACARGHIVAGVVVHTLGLLFTKINLTKWFAGARIRVRWAGIFVGACVRVLLA